jgi:glyoxylase-like metal-dependent hydrolase (beta-lactamase superfamily II)
MYNGNTYVGGPAQVRELPNLTISKISVGSFGNNSYLLRCANTGAGVLIDAAAEPTLLLALIGPGGVDGVLTTHGHRDHWNALPEVIAATEARTYAPAADVTMITVRTDQALTGGSSVTFGDITVKVLTTGGHTPGASMFLYEDPFGHGHLFSGDCLFPGGIGKTTNPEDFATLLNAVKSQVFDVLPDTTWVYPGHGADTHVGMERGSLGEWGTRGW